MIPRAVVPTDDGGLAFDRDAISAHFVMCLTAEQNLAIMKYRIEKVLGKVDV